MALNVADRVVWELPPADPDVLSERSRELREWLSHLESWVETQLVATEALVAMLDEDPSTVDDEAVTVSAAAR